MDLQSSLFELPLTNQLTCPVPVRLINLLFFLPNVPVTPQLMTRVLNPAINLLRDQHENLLFNQSIFQPTNQRDSRVSFLHFNPPESLPISRPCNRRDYQQINQPNSLSAIQLFNQLDYPPLNHRFNQQENRASNLLIVLHDSLHFNPRIDLPPNRLVNLLKYLAGILPDNHLEFPQIILRCSLRRSRRFGLLESQVSVLQRRLLISQLASHLRGRHELHLGNLLCSRQHNPESIPLHNHQSNHQSSQHVDPFDILLCNQQGSLLHSQQLNQLHNHQFFQLFSLQNNQVWFLEESQHFSHCEFPHNSHLESQLLNRAVLHHFFPQYSRFRHQRSNLPCNRLSSPRVLPVDRQQVNQQFRH